MNPEKKFAVVTFLDKEMRARGSWCGETHLQKGVFLLQQLYGTDLGYDFILYRHGPFSFDLRDDLSELQAAGLLGMVVEDSNYGPRLLPTDFSVHYLERFPKTLARVHDSVQSVADELGNKGVVELERLATAVFLALEYRGSSPDDLASLLCEYKPHIRAVDALNASKRALKLLSTVEDY